MPSSRTPDVLDSPAFGEDLDRLVHDARTPLSSLLLWVRLLRGGQAQAEAATAAIERNAVSLSERLDHIQELADRVREVQSAQGRGPEAEKSAAKEKPRPRRAKSPRKAEKPGA
ncbi:MAG: hypothetical protein U0441_19600 [Polyangiaceae bacterium]